MPFNLKRPITAQELVEAASWNITPVGTALFLKGLSPGLGALGAFQLGHRLCLSRRYELPAVPATDRRAVAIRASARLGSTASGDPYCPAPMIENILAHGIHGFLREIQIGHVGRAIDEAWDEVRNERLSEAAQ